jgi:FkbM family methyltransferase
MEVNRQNWFEAKGDETLALDWPLTPLGRVWEIGGFEGRWVKQMAEKFGCFIDVFEPQMWAVERMRTKFDGNDKITIHPFGLWVDNGYQRIGNFGTDGATIMGNAEGQTEMGEFRLYSDVMETLPLPVDVCLMNIEGAEYFLLPAMIHSGWIENFDHFWCQFHTSKELAEGQSERIMESMLTTHELLWDCFPTAVAWRRK